MKKLFVKFNHTEEIVNFVRIISRYDYDADVRYGSRIVDAKSIVGVLSLAKEKTVELILHTEDCGSLLEEISHLAA